MTYKEAQEVASVLFKDTEVVLRKVNGVCQIVREPEGAETEHMHGACGEDCNHHGLQVTKDRKLLLGSGVSWKSALKYASKPVLEAQQLKEREAQQKRFIESKETQVDGNKFVDFLREIYAKDFLTWKATGGKRSNPDLVCHDDFETPEEYQAWKKSIDAEATTDPALSSAG